MLRRANEPDSELHWALLESARRKLACEYCGHVGLDARRQADDFDDAWPSAAVCRACGAVIPAERLEVFPDARLCARCQHGAETAAAEPREFCPRCGAVMKMRSSGGSSITRYQMACDACGYRG